MKIFILSILFLSGCCTTACKPTVVDRNVMITIPCKISVPEKPAMPLTDSGKQEEDIFNKTKKALAELDIRRGYESELEAAIESCQ